MERFPQNSKWRERVDRAAGDRFALSPTAIQPPANGSGFLIQTDAGATSHVKARLRATQRTHRPWHLILPSPLFFPFEPESAPISESPVATVVVLTMASSIRFETFPNIFVDALS